MLNIFNSYVKSFNVAIDEQLQSGLLPQNVRIELLADQRPANEHRRRYTRTKLTVKPNSFYTMSFQRISHGTHVRKPGLGDDVLAT